MATDLINDWNSFMVMKITEADLRSPGEQFFRRCLIQILKHLNIRTTAFEISDSDPKERIRLARVKLCKSVEHFLKICAPRGPKNTFVYMDLVKPSTRKMINVLKFLLNYVLYFQMLKEETIDVAMEQLKEKNKLIEDRNKLKKELEHAKLNEENYKKHIEDLKQKIPKQTNHLSELEEKENLLKGEIVKCQEEMQKVELQGLTTKSEIDDIKQYVVTEIEAKSIVGAKRQIETQLEEQEEFLIAARKKFFENSDTIKELNQLVAKIELVLKSFNIDTTQMRHMRKENIKLLKENDQIKREVDDFKLKLRSLEVMLESSADELKSNQNKSSSKVRKLEKELNKLKSVLNEKLITVKQVRSEEAKAIEEQETVKRESEILYQLYSNTMMFINNN